MRNRVAMNVARGMVRVSVVLALVPVALVVGVTSASATAIVVAAEGPSFGIGPVGIAAVVVGFGGLVTGLMRHRRREGAAVSHTPRPQNESAGDRAA